MTTSVFKNDGSFNVKDFGAVGDGVTNDAPAINAAIQAHKAMWWESGVVWFPPGKYWIEEPIVVDDNGITLKGSGHSDKGANYNDGSTIIVGDAFVDNTGVGEPAAVRFGTVGGDGRPVIGGGVEDLALDGNSQGTETTGFYLRSARGRFINVFVGNAAGHGMVLEGADPANNDGVDWDTYDTVIHNLQAADNAKSGFKGTEHGTADLHLTNCIAYGNKGHGFEMKGASCQITAAHAYGNGVSGVSVEAVRMWVTGCKLEGNQQNGLHAKTVSPEFSGGLIVNDNGFKGNSRAGDGLHSSVLIEADSNTGEYVIDGNRFSTVESKPLHAIDLNMGGSEINQGIIDSNVFARGYTDKAVRLGGSNASGFKWIIADNIGFVTRNRGESVLPSGAASVSVPHGLDVTPNHGEIQATWKEAAKESLYVTNLNATTFDVRVPSNIGADTQFVWLADASAPVGAAGV